LFSRAAAKENATMISVFYLSRLSWRLARDILGAARGPAASMVVILLLY